jgi:hypothetical protein
MKTVERAHKPAQLWHRVALDKNYAKALKQVDGLLSHWYVMSPLTPLLAQGKGAGPSVLCARFREAMFTTRNYLPGARGSTCVHTRMLTRKPASLRSLFRAGRDSSFTRVSSV